MLQLLLFQLLLLLPVLGACLALCLTNKKKKQDPNGQSMSRAGTPGANDKSMKTAIEGGGGQSDVGGSNENTGRISIHGPVHESKESAEQVEGEVKVPSAETINMEKAAPGKVVVSREKA